MAKNEFESLPKAMKAAPLKKWIPQTMLKG